LSWSSRKPSIETVTPSERSGENEQIFSAARATSSGEKPFVGIDAEKKPHRSK